ncbi:MAG TPA: HNH endonuclease signature motif containing protein, partial [Jatrophihabitans sp.]|nr:HNH endonuclease signature motif containing protein [Jatrophihabitans sp.]
MTAEQFATGTGLPHTSFGQRLTVGQALRVAGEASVGWVVHDSTGAVLKHGRSKRIATGGQTLALIARDRGCAFPFCTAPPEWTERHHILPWSHGGETNLSNLVL